MADDGVVLLDEKSLRELARVIYYQEVEAIYHIKFASESELSKYLSDIKANYQSVLGLLDSGRQVKLDLQHDASRFRVAADIFSYILNSANIALQFVRNFNLRSHYIKKVEEHAKALSISLRDLHCPLSLAEEASQASEASLQYARAVGCRASRSFSSWPGGNNLQFEELLASYKAKLGFQKPFQQLADAEKLKVYDKVLEDSGRVRGVVNKIYKITDLSAQLLTAGLLVWDMIVAENKLHRFLHDSAVIVASEGGAMLGNIIGVAFAAKLASFPVTTVLVTVAGIVIGIAGAFILGEIAGGLIDLIIGSGGSAPFSTDGHRCYVAPLPDGKALALQIAHRDKLLPINP